RRGEPSGELAPALHGLAYPAPPVLAHRPRVFPDTLERPIEPGRRHLQVVGRLDQRRRVEHVAGLPAQRLAVGDGHAARLVDEEPQDPPAALSLPLAIDQLEPVRRQDGADRSLDTADPVVPVLHPPALPRKQNGRPPLSSSRWHNDSPADTSTL